MDIFKKLNLEFREADRYDGVWLWPADDVWGWKNLTKKHNATLPEIVASYDDKKDLIIQAGGNCGLYPKHYSKHFKKVITFEPDYRNFFCLSYNVHEENVFKFQACLGDTNISLKIEENPIYLGLASLTVTGEGVIPQLTIDSLNLNPTLIHLDIEGYEGFALLGAEQTIKRCKPVIALETNGIGDAHGWTKEKLTELLEDWGYEIILDMGHDTIYKAI